jgi:hypothetical protein
METINITGVVDVPHATSYVFSEDVEPVKDWKFSLCSETRQNCRSVLDSTMVVCWYIDSNADLLVFWIGVLDTAWLWQLKYKQ